MRKILSTTLVCLLLASSALAAFPTTSVLDNFNRADENPLSTAGSIGAPIYSVASGGAQTFKLTGNAIQDDSLADGGGSAQMYWSAANFGPGSEAFVTLNNPWANNSSDLWLWMNGNAESTSGMDGYVLYTFYNAGTWSYVVTRNDNAVGTELTPSAEAGPTLANGDKFGGEITSGGTITFYYKAAAGSWGPASGVSTRSDATYTSGHIGVSKGFNDVTTTLDDFGGGTIVASSVRRTFMLLGVGP